MARDKDDYYSEFSEQELPPAESQLDLIMKFLTPEPTEMLPQVNQLDFIKQQRMADSMPSTRQPVITGASQEEMGKAEMLHAQNLLKIQAKREEAQNAERMKMFDAVNSLSAMSKEAAPSDTYAARGDDIMRGDWEEGAKGGSYSKSNAPANKLEAALPMDQSQLEQLGVPPSMIELFKGMGNVKNPRQAAVMQMIMQTLGNNRRADPAEILKRGQESRDPISSLEMTKAALRQAGLSEEDIERLFKGRR